jgi:hypothetical protein
LCRPCSSSTGCSHTSFAQRLNLLTTLLMCCSVWPCASICCISARPAAAARSICCTCALQCKGCFGAGSISTANRVSTCGKCSLQSQDGTTLNRCIACCTLAVENMPPLGNLQVDHGVSLVLGARYLVLHCITVLMAETVLTLSSCRMLCWRRPIVWCSSGRCVVRTCATSMWLC